ncbi:transposon Ty3-I Gag-Pol polyprotein [Trichonephila clavipes]|nr:transposon Ty3-I Gag-Pol polyprotein [Trichonephila clavipes]
MEKAAESASLTAAQKQKAYGDYFNKRSSVKNFSIGEQVVLLKYHPRALAVGVILKVAQNLEKSIATPNLSRSTSERVLHEINLNHLKESEREQVLTIVLKHQTLFTSDVKIAESLKIKVDEQIEELLRLDLIEESDAEIAYPIVCVNKKDGTLRLCVDFRALNSESVSDDFPMEDAVELIHSIGRANIITTLDLLKGYWAIPMAEDSKNLTSFKTHRNSTVSSKSSAKGMTDNVCRKSPHSRRAVPTNIFCSRLNLVKLYEMSQVKLRAFLELNGNFRIKTHSLHPYVCKSGRENYGRPALSGKVIRTPKIRFQILTPHSKTHMGLTCVAPVGASSVARGNDNPNVGLERKAFSRNSDGRPALLGKVKVISEVRFQNFVHHPEIHQKRNFFALRPLGEKTTDQAVRKDNPNKIIPGLAEAFEAQGLNGSVSHFPPRYGVQTLSWAGSTQLFIHSVGR